MFLHRFCSASSSRVCCRHCLWLGAGGSSPPLRQGHLPVGLEGKVVPPSCLVFYPKSWQVPRGAEQKAYTGMPLHSTPLAGGSFCASTSENCRYPLQPWRQCLCLRAVSRPPSPQPEAAHAAHPQHQRCMMLMGACSLTWLHFPDPAQSPAVAARHCMYMCAIEGIMPCGATSGLS